MRSEKHIYLSSAFLSDWKLKRTSSWLFINSCPLDKMAAILADNIFKCIFLNENGSISIQISLKFVPKGSVDNKSALVQVMAWRRPGDKPLSEPMMVILLTHICVTRPLCVKEWWIHCGTCNSWGSVLQSCDAVFWLVSVYNLRLIEISFAKSCLSLCLYVVEFLSFHFCAMYLVFHGANEFLRVINFCFYPPQQTW